MFKSFISADRLQRAAILLRDQEKQEQTSSLYELRNAFSPDALENSRIRTWNKVRTGLDAASLSVAPDRTQTSRRRRKRLLAALMIIMLLLGMTLAVSAGAREIFLGMFRIIRATQIDYEFDKDTIDPMSELPHLNANDYFKEFELKRQTDFPEYINEYYVNSFTNDVIIYTCTTTSSSTEFGVVGNTETRESVIVHGYDADLYHSTESVPENTLIWVDAQRNIAIMVSTTLGLEELYDIAELCYK